MAPKAKYETIYEDIKELIRNGDIKPGGKIPSISVIREKYGVSHVTALRGLKQLVNQNYMDFVKGKGYYAKISRGFLEEKQFTRSIACFLRPYRPITGHDNYYNEINMSVQRECLRRGFDIITPKCVMPLEDPNPDPHSLTIIIDKMIAMNGVVDGYIIDDRITDTILSSIIGVIDKSLVIVNRTTNLPLDSVDSDNIEGAKRASEVCMKLGYERFILCRNLLSPIAAMNQRVDSFRKTLLTSGISGECIYEIEYNLKPFDYTLSLIAPLLKDHRKTLIFCSTDSFARELTDQFYGDESFKTSNVGILGFDGLDITRTHSPMVSTVNVHPEEIGKKAVDVLIAKIHGNHMREGMAHIVPSTFIIGETI